MYELANNELKKAEEQKAKTSRMGKLQIKPVTEFIEKRKISYLDTLLELIKTTQ